MTGTEGVPKAVGATDRETAARLVGGALAGEALALEELVHRLTPVIHARVARLLSGSASGGSARLRQQVEDLVQEVFVALFERGGRVLESWRPEQGLSLENFVGLVAQRRTISLLRSGRRNPWREEPTAAEDLDRAVAPDDPERSFAGREEIGRLLDRLRAELSPLGWRLFRLLYLEERSVAAVGRTMGMTADAVYAWRSRLRRTARSVAAQRGRIGPAGGE